MPNRTALSLNRRRCGSFGIALALALVFGLGAAPAVSAATPRAEVPRVRIVRSEVLSLLYLVESVLGTPSRTPHLAPLYQRHRASLGGGDDPIATIRALVRNPGPGAGASRGGAHGLLELMEIAASQSRNLDDFAVRTLGLLPLVDHARLLAALRRIAPLHRRHVWRPSLGFLARTERGISGLLRRLGGRRLLARLATFYGSRWPPGLPLTVALVPVPGQKRSGGTTSYGHSVEAVAVVEVLEQDDPASRLSVAIHEICHALHRMRTPAQQRKLRRWFGADAAFGPLAHQELDEAIATAVGSGYIHTRTHKGRQRTGRWYEDDVIDGFSRALYPTVNDYLDQQRPLDELFARNAVSLFAARFPRARLRPRVLLQRVSLFVDRTLDARALLAALRHKTRVRSSHLSSPLDHAKTVANYRKLRSATALFVLGPSGVDRLQHYPFAAKVKPSLLASFARGRTFVYAYRGANRRMSIFVGVSDPRDAVAAIARLTKLAAVAIGQAKPL